MLESYICTRVRPRLGPIFVYMCVLIRKQREIAASLYCYVCRKAASTWAFIAACCSEDPCFVHPSATAAPAAVPPTIPLPLDISTVPPAVPRPSVAFDVPLAAPPSPALPSSPAPSALAPPPTIARGGRAGAAYNTFASPSRCCSMRKKKTFGVDVSGYGVKNVILLLAANIILCW